MDRQTDGWRTKRSLYGTNKGGSSKVIQVETLNDYEGFWQAAASDAENSRSACFDWHNFIRTGIKYDKNEK